ncbi:MAG: hypothetical protein WBG41_09925 [Acidimicrobiales bacterium]
MRVGGLIGRLFLVGLVAMVCLGVGATAASAAATEKATLSHGTNGQANSSGEAKKVKEGGGGEGALLTSNNYGYGLINVRIPAGTTLSDLTALNTGYEVTEGTCGGGAPRFQVVVLAPGAKRRDAQEFDVYFGTQPYGGCSSNQGITTEDATQDDWWLAPGNSYGSYSEAQSTYGSDRVLDVQVAVDGGWDQSPETQQVLIQDLTVGINGTNTTFFPLPS